MLDFWPLQSKIVIYVAKFGKILFIYMHMCKKMIKFGGQNERTLFDLIWWYFALWNKVMTWSNIFK